MIEVYWVAHLNFIHKHFQYGIFWEFQAENKRLTEVRGKEKVKKFMVRRICHPTEVPKELTLID